MFSKMTVRDIDVQNKKVLVRTMLNVPISDNTVTDERRLKAALPTIQYLLEQNAAIILISHHSDEGQSLAPVAPVLSGLVGKDVGFVPDCLGGEAERAVADIRPGDILMLENLRFHPQEEANDEDFAKTLAGYAEVYINDDFTTCHRMHASLVGIPKFLPAVAGFGVETEVSTITGALENPKRPLVAISGGAKISTKLPMLNNLLDKVDTLVIGGAMANTFLGALGKPIGKSLTETNQYDNAIKIMDKAAKQGKTFLLPTDAVVTTDLKTKANIRTVAVEEVGEDDIIADIGPKTAAEIAALLHQEGSVLWNGPLGIAEEPEFSKGTKLVAESIIDSHTYSLVGGGDTADYVDNAGIAEKFGFVSTGGGASMELMAGNTLPGVEALRDK